MSPSHPQQRSAPPPNNDQTKHHGAVAKSDACRGTCSRSRLGAGSVRMLLQPQHQASRLCSGRSWDAFHYNSWQRNARSGKTVRVCGAWRYVLLILWLHLSPRIMTGNDLSELYPGNLTFYPALKVLKLDNNLLEEFPAGLAENISSLEELWVVSWILSWVRPNHRSFLLNTAT